MNLNETFLKETKIFDGKIFRVHVDDVLLPNGKKAKREIVEHSGGVMIAALDSEFNLTFVRQFRYPYKSVLLELPAGKLEKGEEPLFAAKRELREECGLIAKNVRSLGEIYPTVAYCSEIIHMFLATGLEATQNDLDDGEFLETKKMSLDDAFRLVMDGQIKDSKTVCAVLKIKALKDAGEL